MRGCLLTTASAGLGTTAHALADGTLPDLPMTALLTALIGWTSTSLAHRTRGAVGILAILGSGQLAMHLVLTDLVGHGHQAPGASNTMTTAHVLATILTAVVLARAETLLLLVEATLRLVLPTVHGPAPVPAGPRPATSPQAGPRPLDLYFRRAHGRRGPPATS